MSFGDTIRRQTSRSLAGKLLVGGVALIAGTAIVLPFFLFQYDWAGSTRIGLRLLNTHDLATAVAIMEQFDKGLRSGILYPRWLPDINYGYGVATMVFYQPVVFYISSLIHSVVGNWLVTVLIIAAASSAASGLALYGLLRLFVGRLASGIGALFYIVIPYHVLDLYWRGALPEFVGFAFLPVVLYFVYKLGTEARLRYYAGLGFFYGIYLMTHLPVGYLFTYALGFHALLWAYKSRNIGIAIRIAGGMTLGLVLSAIYWLPAALETKDTFEPVTSIFPYDRSYITLQPGNNAFDDLVNSVFSYQALALLLIIAVLHLINRKTGESQGDDSAVRDSLQPQLWKILALTATFMSTSFSIYISKLIPKIQVSVPAWRWLAIASLFTCLLLGVAVDRLANSLEIGPSWLWPLRVALALVLAMNLWLTVGSVMLRASSNGTYMRPDNFVTTGFIPKDAAYPDNLPQTPQVMIEPEGGVIETTRWDPQRREIAVRVDRPSRLRLRTYYFPGWVAHIDGQKAELSRDEGGAQLLAIPEGRHVIEVDFVDTAPRVAGKILFGLGLALILGLAATDYLKQKKTEMATESGSEPVKARDPALRFRVSRTSALVSGGVILLIGILAFAVIRLGGSKGETTASKQPPGTTASSGEVRLSVAGWDSIPVAVSEKDLDELLGAISTRNNDRVEEMISSGRAFRAKANSRVRVVKTGYGKLNIRMVEGESITLEGWVPERWVK